MMTWGEVQIEACKKMFLNSDIISTDDLNNLRVNNNYKTYFNGMAQAANEGIAEILKRGKPYIKTLSFTRKTSDNLLGNRLGIVYDHTNDDIVFEIDKGLAYYFEVDNEATIEVYVGDEIVEVIENDVENLGSYTKYKNFLENNDNKTVKLVFKGDHPYHIRNVCIYDLNYNYGNENDSDYIPDYTNELIIDLKTAVNDFYKVFKFYVNKYEMINNTDYKMIDHYTMLLRSSVDGEYIIKYQCYPETITDETDDEYEIPLEQEMVVLLPLYMASELYKDDDVSLATMYRNEFEAMVDNRYPKNEDLKFVCKTGWL